MAQKEKDLDIFDVWESPNGNHFIKINNECSIAIGTKDGDGYLQGKPANTPLISKSICRVKKIGRIIFD